MTESTITTRTLVAVLVATTAGLILRSWLQVELLDDGWNRRFAADLSYLVVPPILVLLLFPLWHSHKSFLKAQFQLRTLTWQLVFRGVAVGFLLRLLSWSYLIASVALGWQRSSDPLAFVGPEFSFQCGSPTQVILGVTVMVLMIPFIEEYCHRSVVLTYLRQRGPLIAIPISALIFMVFHPTSSWLFAFLAGLTFGYQYWHSGSLWPSFFSHMTVNGLIQLDWYCLGGRWNPIAADLPLILPATFAITLMIVCIAGIIALLSRYSRGAI